MAIQNINIGTTPNDGTGDSLRVAGQKINDNNNEYSTLISDLELNKVDSVTGDGVSGTASDVVLTFPNADQVNDISTNNKFVRKLYVNLDSAETFIVRTVSGGRTTFTITHSFNTLDLFADIYRLSDGRSINWRVERTGLNTIEASRAGNVADSLFRILIQG